MEDFGCGLACPPMDEVGILGIDLQIHFDLSPEKFFECVQEGKFSSFLIFMDSIFHSFTDF